MPRGFKGAKYIDKGDCFEVILSNGDKSLIDAADYVLIKNFNWHIAKCGKSRYASSTIGSWRKGNRICVYMHRIIAGADSCHEVDHRNHDGLDNRRSNLRLCVRKQNNGNSRHKLGKSGYRGVQPNKKRWIATISIGNKRTHLGSFRTPEEAAKAYDAAAIEHFGEFATINFPQGHSDA